MPERTVLENGLRVVTETMSKMQSVTTSIFVGIGSRYEPPEVNGISHFIEHMLFKGSAKRPARLEIARAIEGVGGHLNGFTHQEATAFYAMTLSEHSGLAADVLSDMLLHPVLDAEEVARERGVVIQEIRTRKDAPQSWVHELLQNAMWREHPLGQPISGTEEVVQKLDRDDCIRYIQDWYHPQNMVLGAAGRIEHAEAVDLVRKYLDGTASGKRPDCDSTGEKQPDFSCVTEKRDCEELHFCIGFRSYPREHKDQYVLLVMDTIMGSGMSSRLFEEIREKRGLAYSVGAYPRFFQDTGAWVVYASVEPHRTSEALNGVIEQLHRIRDEDVAEDTLKEAKQFLKGSLLLSLESTSAYAMMLGEHELLTGKLITPDEIGARIDAVTIEDVRRVASEILKRRKATVAVVGPFDDKIQEQIPEMIAL